MKSSEKYPVDKLIPAFCKAAAFRDEMLDLGFTDNGGAIHSAERILNILGLRLNYPGLSHINNYRKYPKAEFSLAALEAHRRGEKVLIEHVSPLRDFTRKAIDLVKKTSPADIDKKLRIFVKKNYRLALLTADETVTLNRTNRSIMTKNRVAEIPIANTGGRKTG